nr:hypothetical protein P5630_19400 [Bacillus subtilis]
MESGRGNGYEPKGSFTLNEKEISVNEHKPLQQMLLFGALCNNSNIEKRDGEYVLDGDPTEGALRSPRQEKAVFQRSLLNQTTG